jgi:hypothetical protein
VKFHEWLFSLEESAAAHANHLTMHAQSPDGRPACPFPIATCKAEELLVLDLNSLLHLFLEISTCRYRVTLQIPLVYPTGQQNGGPLYVTFYILYILFSDVYVL